MPCHGTSAVSVFFVLQKKLKNAYNFASQNYAFLSERRNFWVKKWTVFQCFVIFTCFLVLIYVKIRFPGFSFFPVFFPKYSSLSSCWTCNVCPNGLWCHVWKEWVKTDVSAVSGKKRGCVKSTWHTLFLASCTILSLWVNFYAAILKLWLFVPRSVIWDLFGLRWHGKWNDITSISSFCAFRMSFLRLWDMSSMAKSRREV